MTQENPVYANTVDGGNYKRIKAGINSSRVMQPIVMADTDFIKLCTNQERLIIMRIMTELKEYNCLWNCGDDIKTNSKNRIALKSLLNKGVLQKTETTNIYVVNPFFIRRGDLMSVITTTAKLLENASKVDTTYITNKKPVNNYVALLTNTPTYGYETDDIQEAN